MENSTTLRHYNWKDRKQYAEDSTLEVIGILREIFPSALSIERTTNAQDRTGADFLVKFADERDPIKVDVKIRSGDPFVKSGNDDLALEIWSDVENEKLGWTRDPAKQTDYILWYFTDSKRWVFIPFPMLLAVMQDNWARWARTFRIAFQQTSFKRKGADYSWRSMVVFVPTREIWAQIYLKYAAIDKVAA